MHQNQNSFMLRISTTIVHILCNLCPSPGPGHVIISWQPSTNTVHSTFLAVKFSQEKLRTWCLKLFSSFYCWRRHVFQTTNAAQGFENTKIAQNYLFILDEKHLEHFLFYRGSTATPGTERLHVDWSLFAPAVFWAPGPGWSQNCLLLMILSLISEHH